MHSTMIKLHTWWK